MFCPKCRSEFRPGFTTCKTCGGVALVDALPEQVEMKLDLDDAKDTLPVGFLSGGVGSSVEVDGVQVDPQRIFELEAATQHRVLLASQGLPSILVPLDIEFPDNRARFEVRVRSEVHERAEAALVAHWQKLVEAQGLGASQKVDFETCPACGEHVDLTAAECPECGLVVGVGAEPEAAEGA